MSSEKIEKKRTEKGEERRNLTSLDLLIIARRLGALAFRASLDHDWFKNSLGWMAEKTLKSMRVSWRAISKGLMSTIFVSFPNHFSGRIISGGLTRARATFWSFPSSCLDSKIEKRKNERRKKCQQEEKKKLGEEDAKKKPFLKWFSERFELGFRQWLPSGCP